MTDLEAEGWIVIGEVHCFWVKTRQPVSRRRSRARFKMADVLVRVGVHVARPEGYDTGAA